MKRIILLFCLFFSILSFSQSNFKKFQKLSSPMQTWVVLHPFKAKKALEISKETKQIIDSLLKKKFLDRDRIGGQLDAFKHAFWMASLRQEIGENAARSLGRAHEKDNYLTYKKLKLEDKVVPDKISSEMDLYNNDVGLTLTKKGGKLSKNQIIYRVVKAIRAGKMKVIKKDKKKQFLTCKGEIIDKESLKGKWENEKCLVMSNYKKEK